MAWLVGNGTKLYRRSSSLVRTPITITLQPDQRAVYRCAGRWTQQGTVWWPDGGFIAQNTMANVASVGYDCLQAYSQHSDTRVGWSTVNTSHDPETVWYHGAYATGAATAAGGTQSCEAYVQNGAYHFTIPQSLQSLDLQSVTVRFTNGGAVFCYGTAGGKSNNNDAWKNHTSAGETSWYLPFAVAQTLGHIQSLAACPYDAAVDIMNHGTACKGVRDLWGYSGTNRDGAIPTLTTPIVKSYTMGAQTLAAMQSSGGGWIVPYINFRLSSGTDYRPQCVPPNPLYWACVSVWGISIDVTVG